MPSKIIDGYRFFFYSNERNEPPHMHVWKGGSEAKIWLGTLTFASNYGFNNAELTGFAARQGAILMNSTISGMTTSPTESFEIVRIADVIVETDNLILHLNDGRAILLDMRLYPWLQWLLEATPDQRSRWEIVPSGGGVWWTELDEGIELQPLLDMQPLPTTQELPILA